MLKTFIKVKNSITTIFDGKPVKSCPMRFDRNSSLCVSHYSVETSQLHSVGIFESHFCSANNVIAIQLEISKACNVSPSSVYFHRAIERIYKEHCEENCKEQPDCLDSSTSDDLMLTDSTVWAKVLRSVTLYI